MLRSRAVCFVQEPSLLWNMTAYETDEIIAAGMKREAKRRRENELLAFNIGALVLSAFNVPQRFPRTPDEAFGRSKVRPDGGKSDFAEIARQINARIDSARNNGGV